MHKVLTLDAMAALVYCETNKHTKQANLLIQSILEGMTLNEILEETPRNLSVRTTANYYYKYKKVVEGMEWLN